MAEPDINKLQAFVASVAIGPSTLRNQGARGIMRTARSYLAHEIELKRYATDQEHVFGKQLASDTEKLSRKLSPEQPNWGAARKALNVFLRDALYNHYLRRRYGLRKAEAFFEIPLDSRVTRELRQLAGRGSLKGWTSIRNLVKPVSDRFQLFAQKVATNRGMARVHLDILFWTPDTAASGPRRS